MDFSDPDTFELRNRNEIYLLSRQRFFTFVPYFNGMFGNENRESITRKVRLDLDEKGLDNVINWVISKKFVLSMDTVIGTYVACDYLGVDHLSRVCGRFFHQNFDVSHIPVVINTHVYRDELISIRNFDSFVCRYFLNIMNTQSFLDFSFEIVEYVYGKRLVVDSECQAFNAIIKWVEYKEGRSMYMVKLMRLIQWRNIDTDTLNRILKMELMQSQPGLESLIEELKYRPIMRNNTDRSPFLIYYINETMIKILKVKRPNVFTYVGEFVLDRNLTHNILVDKFTVDILYDSGRKIIRIHLERKKFNYLKMCGSSDSHLRRLHRFIFRKLPRGLEEDSWSPSDPKKSRVATKSAIIEMNGILVSVGWDDNPEIPYYSEMRNPSWFTKDYEFDPCYHVVGIRNKIFIIKRNLEMLIIDTINKSFESVLSLLHNNYDFEDLMFFAHNDKLNVFCKYQSEVLVYEEETQEWSGKYRVHKMVEYDTRLIKLITISTTYTVLHDTL